MNYWLMKSEPDVFSILHLQKMGTAEWDGVRNYKARNFLKLMRKGDRVFFYHSSTKPTSIVGEMTVAREAYPDPSQFDRKSPQYDPNSKESHPRWVQVDVTFVEVFPKSVSLDAVKKHPDLKHMVLVERARLSVQPVTPAEWDIIYKLCH